MPEAEDAPARSSDRVTVVHTIDEDTSFIVMMAAYLIFEAGKTLYSDILLPMVIAYQAAGKIPQQLADELEKKAEEAAEIARQQRKRREEHPEEAVPILGPLLQWLGTLVVPDAPPYPWQDRSF